MTYGTHELADAILPERVNPVPLGPLAGDHADDDGQVMQDDWARNDPGPDEQGGVPHAKPVIKPESRLITRSLNIGDPGAGGNGFDPFMLIAPDPNRTLLSVMYVTASNALLPAICLGSTKSDTYGGTHLIVPVFNNFGFNAIPQLVLPNYTGALWVKCDAVDFGNNPFSVAIQVVAVTE